MSSKTKTYSVAAIRKSFHLLAACALVAGFAYAQAGQSQPIKDADAVGKDTISDLIDKARPDTPDSIYYVERIAEARALDAVPMLEEKEAFR